MPNQRTALVAVIAVATTLSFAFAGEDPPPPPVDPGDGYEGIFPIPPLPPGYDQDQGTSPWGVRSMANAAQASGIRLIQTFTPTDTTVDWFAFVIQNTNQGGAFGPTSYRVRLGTSMNSQGIIGGLLAVSEPASAAEWETGWEFYVFENPVSVTPGQRYYIGLEHHAGYIGNPVGQSGPGFGVRTDNRYAGGQTFRFIDSQFGTFEATNSREDLIFASGRIVPPTCTGDLNIDGTVNTPDLALLLGVFGEFAPPGSAADFNSDGVVDTADLVVFLGRFGSACP